MGLRKGFDSTDPAPQPEREPRAEDPARDDIDDLIASLAESVDPSADVRPVLWVPAAEPHASRDRWPRMRAHLARRGLALYFAAPIVLGVLIGLLAVRLL